jgi:hypothetical protein
MKLLAAGAVSFFLATGLSTTALAGSAWSPPIRIVAIQVAENSGVLRLGMRRSIEITSPFNFNPASCVSLEVDFNLTGFDVRTQYFDVQLSDAERSVTEQRQLLIEIYSAFATGRNVSLLVRDDLCTTSNGRVAAGIQILN